MLGVFAWTGCGSDPLYKLKKIICINLLLLYCSLENFFISATDLWKPVKYNIIANRPYR